MLGGGVYTRRMSPEEAKLLILLLGGRVDPRRGVGRLLGTARVYVLPVYLAAYAIALLIYKYNGSGIASTAKSVIAYSTIAVLGACWLIPLGIRRRTRRRCHAHAYFLCPWCRYTLEGLDDDGLCPECGKRYERAVCEQLYANVYSPGAPKGDALERADRQAWSAAIRMQHRSDDD